MAEQSHTAGPWAVAEMDCLLGTEFIPIEGADGFRIAEVLGADDPNVVSPQDAANARLIAAAPELLEALKSLSAVAEMTTFSDQYPLECEMASTAIAKATGGSV